MASNPKQQSRPRRPSPPPMKKAVELPFDDGEVTPLRAEPSPMSRKGPRKAEEVIPTSVYEIKPQDEELPPSYANGDLSDPDFKPAFLYVERGPGAGQLVPVRQGLLVIGRASVSDLRLQHPSISRRHAQITRKGDFFYLKDFGSQNGTYVNRTKIDTEVEIQPGDEIAVGNALLKLRGPVQAADSRAVSYTPPKKKKKSTSGAVKVALFAGAVGFGLAAVMMFALLRTQHAPTFTDLPAKKSVAAAPAVVEEKARANDEPIVIADDEVSVKIQKAEKEAAKTQPAETREEPVAKKEEVREAPVSALAAAKGQIKKTEPKKVAAVTTKKAASKADEAFEDEEDSAPAAKSSGGNDATILARYEAGNVGAAIELAKKMGNKELLGKLSKFDEAYSAAKAALTRSDASGAVKNFEKALKQDEQLSSGWGTYGVEIRKELTRIWLLAGDHYAKAGQTTQAKAAYQSALKYDAKNSHAKSALANLGSDDEEKPAAAPAKKRIASAFDDEDAPAPKKSAKAKVESKRAAIDDAFGD